jgi:15-cis-phytoene synthase
MDHTQDDLLPPQRLAIAYAPKQVRAQFALLLRFDVRLAGIIENAREPLIAQIKLAWWRDAIMASVSARPKGEPLLSDLFALDDPALTQGAAELVNAWELLVEREQWPAETTLSFAQIRGRAIFGAYSRLCDQPELPAMLGQQWAADDLRQRFGDRVMAMQRADLPLPKNRIIRPLTILALSVRGVSGPRLIWHALTGR